MPKSNSVDDDRAAARKHDVDTRLHVDGEEDTLYDDGLEVDEEAGQLAGTRGDTPGIAKP